MFYYEIKENEELVWQSSGWDSPLSNPGSVGSITGPGAKIPHDLGSKSQNINNGSNVVTNSVLLKNKGQLKKTRKEKEKIKIFLIVVSSEW